MSFDRQIDQVCTHLIVEELLAIGDDRVTVTPIRPISSFDSVRVRLNGVVDCPVTGVDIPATGVASRSGPYTITSSSNQLVFTVYSGATQTVTLPVATKISADRLVDLLNTQCQGISFFIERNTIRFKTNLSGDGATVYFFPQSTMGPVLGIPLAKEFRGRRTVPAWTLVSDPNTLSDRPKRLIVFDEPLKGFQDYVEVNYTTVREECRRCGGLGVENDWRYGIDGNVAEVRDEALLIQEMQKAIYTQSGSNIFHPWYGTSLLDNVGKKGNLAGLVQTTIVSDVQQMFRRWQAIKTQQERDVGQPVSDEEFPFRLMSVDIEQSNSDPTVIFVNITLQNRSFKPVQISRGLRLPASLSFSSAGQGTIRQSLNGISQAG